MPAFSISSTCGFDDLLAAGTITSPVAGSITSWAAVRPRTRLPSEAMISPASMIGRAVIEALVPQSTSEMMASCATSTRRRVR